MNKLILRLVVLTMIASLSFMGTALADANEVVALQNEMKVLKKELAGLKGELKAIKSEKGKAAYIPAAPKDGGMISLPQNINMGGYVETQWNNNFNQPNGVTGTNSLRIFDGNDGSFSLNAAEIFFEKPAEEIGDAGFRIDIMYGSDTTTVAADGLTGDAVDLQQAYVEYIAPLPNLFENDRFFPDSVKIQAGRFVTLAGYEVIEGPDNWNISRAMLFGLAIPFTHTGVRFNFGLLDDYFDVYFGINNGWDQAIDVNSDKTLEWGIGYEPIEDVSVFHAFYLGQEGAGNATNRFLVTNVIQWAATDKLTLVGDIDYGVDANAFDPNSGDWYGFAGYANYQFTEKFAMTYRIEFFTDDSALRTGLADDHFVGNTITAEYKLTPNLITRAELRIDAASDRKVLSPGITDPIAGPSSGTGGDSTQTTIGAQMIYVI